MHERAVRPAPIPEGRTDAIVTTSPQARVLQPPDGGVRLSGRSVLAGAAIGLLVGCLAAALLPAPPGGPRLVGFLGTLAASGAGMVTATDASLARWMLARAPAGLPDSPVPSWSLPALWMVLFMAAGLGLARWAKGQGADSRATGLAGVLGFAMTVGCTIAAILLRQHLR